MKKLFCLFGVLLFFNVAYAKDVTLEDCAKILSPPSGNSVDYKKAVKCFSSKSLEDNSSAMIHLYVLYKNGLGTEKDELKADKYLDMAIEKKDSGAYIIKGMQSFTKNTDQDRKVALYFFEKAANDDNNSIGMMMSSIVYMKGVDGEVDNKKSFEYMKKAMELGVPQEFSDGYYVMAIMYDRGIGTEVDMEKAFKYFGIYVLVGSEPNAIVHTSERIKFLKNKIDTKRLSVIKDEIKQWCDEHGVDLNKRLNMI